MLLAGDNVRAAEHMASEAGTTDPRTECAPEDKDSAIGEIQAEGGKACMAGDGVNDIPAPKRAWVGAAMAPQARTSPLTWFL